MTVREWVRESCAAQGLPEFITDKAVIERAVAIVRPALQHRSNGDGPVHEHRPVEERAASSAQKAG